MPNIFEGRLIRLRAVEPEDWEHHYQWDISDTDGGRLTDEIRFPSTREAVRQGAEEVSKKRGDDDVFRFSIETLGGEWVGTLNTHTANRRCGTFMYGLGIVPAHRRKGYASEAIRLVVHYYFHERRYQKVNAEVYSFNEASIRLHETLGFTLEGRLRRMIYTNGAYHDALIFGLTREEFDAREGGAG